MAEAAFLSALWWLSFGSVTIALLGMGIICLVGASHEAHLGLLVFALAFLVLGGSVGWMLNAAAATA